MWNFFMGILVGGVGSLVDKGEVKQFQDVGNFVR